MHADLVVDASVVAKFYFEEEDSDRARSLLTSGKVFAAPDLLWLELASVAAKRVRRGLTEVGAALDAVGSLGDIIDELVPARDLARQALPFLVRRRWLGVRRRLPSPRATLERTGRHG